MRISALYMSVCHRWSPGILCTCLHRLCELLHVPKRAHCVARYVSMLLSGKQLCPRDGQNNISIAWSRSVRSNHLRCHQAHHNLSHVTLSTAPKLCRCESTVVDRVCCQCSAASSHLVQKPAHLIAASARPSTNYSSTTIMLYSQALGIQICADRY